MLVALTHFLHKIINVMFFLKTMFRRMIETSTKSTWWTILFELGSIIMCDILMVLLIVMTSVITSSQLHSL